MLIQVSPSLNIVETLSYNYTGNPSLLRPDARVVIPVGNRMTTGWVTDINKRSDYKGKVKNIIGIVRDNYIPHERYMAFVRAVSGIYFTSMGTLLDASLPPKKRPVSSLYFENNEENGKIEKLNKHSLKALLHLSKTKTIECFYKSKDTPQSLLESYVPGAELATHEHETVKNQFIISYQREALYRAIIRDCLKGNQSVLITVPDNLTAAFLKEKLGEIDIYNSEIKPKERDTLWQKYALEGKIGVVVGGLSAALLPIRNLGTLISERAGSPVYKRTYFTRYNIHRLSQLRANHYHIPLIEGFSTLTVQSYQNRSHSHVSIQDKRERKIPVEVRRIKSGIKGVPGDFIELLNGYFIEKKKILIVLNNKESINFLFCGKCKKIRKCPSCDGSIEVDHAFNIKCRRCGEERESFTLCPQCQEGLSIIESVSIASVKKIIKQRVVETGIMTLSAEGLKKEHMHSLMRRLEHSKIVISTPVIINPFFYHLFDVVIYFRPESYFNIDEYDAAEKIFSMVSELRELVKAEGTLDIFSTFSFHYSLKLINEEASYFDRELKYREWFYLPPFFNVYHIEVKGKELRKLAREMRHIYETFKESLKIKRVYLTGRQVYRGTYKGILEAHAQPEAILKSGLLGKRNIFIDLVLI
jgi:primosomal protein N'